MIHLARLGLGMAINIVGLLIHDVIIKHFYCKHKKEKNNRKKCYYWICKNWHNCEYNKGGKS